MKLSFIVVLATLLVLGGVGLPVFAQDAKPSAGLAADDLLTFYKDVPAATQAALDTAVALIAQGKWASAFKALNDFDPQNADPFAVALKTEICLKGNAQTYMHMVFAFIDLEPGQDINQVRMEGAQGVEPIDFDPGAMLAAIEAAGSNVPAILYKEVGDYYYEVLLNYSGQWVEDDTTVMTKILENYERAVAGEAYDDQTLYNQGEILLKTGNNEAAATVLAKYLELKSGDINARLNLARAYAAIGKTAEAFAEIDKVLTGLQDPQARNDAYMFAIQTAVDAGDADRTESYLTAMQNDNPADTVPGLIRHLLAVRTGDDAAADTLADALLEKSEADPNVVRSMISSWLSAQKSEAGMAFLDRGIAKYPGNDQALGTLYFYKSLLIAETAASPEDMGKALELISLAQEYFAKALSPDSPVFATIVDLKVKMKAAMEPEAAAPDAAPAVTPAPDATPAPAATTPAPDAAPAAEGEADATTAATE